MTLRLLAVAPALSAYLLASAPRGSLHHARMSLVDGESVAALPAGLEKEVLRSPLPTAQPCKTGDIALVHFTVAKADGTLLHDSRADEGEPLEFSVGVQPSEVVSRAASSPPALLRRLSQLASAPPTHRPYAAHAPPTRRPRHRPPAQPHTPAAGCQALGWDLALPGMRVGEVARLRCMPHRARTQDQQTGPQAGLLLTRLSLALDRRPRVRLRGEGRATADPAARDAGVRRGAATAAQPDGQVCCLALTLKRTLTLTLTLTLT
eukprot:scaffold18948_cov57-Phaeocystis_antarctica.AAC.2